MKLTKEELDQRSRELNNPEHRKHLAGLSPRNAEAYKRAAKINAAARAAWSAEEDKYLGVASPEIDPDYA